MGILSDFEDRLARAVEGTFAGAFRSPVQPAELARALSHAMDDGKVVGVGKVYAPSSFTVELSGEDARKLGQTFEGVLAKELSTYLLDHARKRDYALANAPTVEFTTSRNLKLGRFRIATDMATPSEGPEAGAAGPAVASAAPVVAGAPPGDAVGSCAAATALGAEPPARPRRRPLRAARGARSGRGGLRPTSRRVRRPPTGPEPAAPVGPARADVLPRRSRRPASAASSRSRRSRWARTVTTWRSRASASRSDASPSAASSWTTTTSRGATPRIVATSGGWTVEDLGSTNGTYLNGKRTQRAMLCRRRHDHRRSHPPRLSRRTLGRPP